VECSFQYPPLPGLVSAAHQGLTLVHLSPQPKPVWSHLPMSPCLIDWGKIMHPTYPTKCAYVEPKSGQGKAPAAHAMSRPWLVPVVSTRLSAW